MPADRFLFVPNGADLHALVEVLPVEQRERVLEFKHRHRKLLAYTGNFGKANNLRALVEALPHLAPAGIGAVLVGSGPEEPALKQLARDLGCGDHVLFLGRIDKAAVPGCLVLMDAAYLGLQDKPLFRFGISPTKVNDYLMAGLPVVLAVTAPIDAEAAGPLVAKCRPDVPAAIAETVIRLCGVEGRELEKGRAQARRWLEENRDYRVLAKRFLDGL
jgi:glycosyltransferase involved in cell wall biosynthesis